MKEFFSFLKKRTAREWGMFFLVVSIGVLASVYISQSFGFHPCKLCIWQRYPYAISAVLSLGLILLATHKNMVSVFLFLLTVTFLIGGGIAFFHLGVEYKWWEFNSDCVGGAFKAGSSPDDFLARLKAAPIVRCDERIPFLFGMTMAFYNVLTSLALTIASVFALYSLRSNSLSQYK